MIFLPVGLHIFAFHICAFHSLAFPTFPFAAASAPNDHSIASWTKREKSHFSFCCICGKVLKEAIFGCRSAEWL